MGGHARPLVPLSVLGQGTEVLEPREPHLQLVLGVNEEEKEENKEIEKVI